MASEQWNVSSVKENFLENKKKLKSTGTLPVYRNSHNM